MSLPLLAELVRSGYVESTHTGSVVALRPDGSVALGLGDLERPIFPRSSNKPLQAVGLLRLGWDPDAEELALATASHNGEQRHVDVVRRILSAASLDPSALRCPAALPLHEPSAHALLAAGGVATPLLMNCSGKHAGMLACSGADLDYLRFDHPVQVAIKGVIEDLAGEPVQHLAVDGCGAPQHALTLPGLARAFSRLASSQVGTPERRTLDAMRGNPWLVGGTGRDVTRLMEGIPGLVAKDGAEGVYAGALADGSAVALKIEDGAGRPRTPVLVAALRVLGVQAEVLEELATTPVLGGGERVGEVRVAGQLAG